jgi:hypothetical protein
MSREPIRGSWAEMIKRTANNAMSKLMSMLYQLIDVACHNGAEDIKHLVFTCDRAKAVWRSIGVWDNIGDLLGADRSGSIILEEVIRRGQQINGLAVGLAELILTGGWYLWWERRQLTHGESVQPPSRSG